MREGALGRARIDPAVGDRPPQCLVGACPSHVQDNEVVKSYGHQRIRNGD